MSDTEKTAMTSEIERLRERAAASEAALEAARSLLAMLRSDLQGCELSLATTERRATKAETERDAALGEVRALRQQLDEATAQCNGLGCGKCASCASAALAQVAVLREALRCELPEAPKPHVLEVADAQAAAVEESRLRHVNAKRARILAALASSPSPTHDYSGLCAAPSCEGHCGYVHARGCEAVREYLADHGGKPYRAPSKAATRG